MCVGLAQHEGIVYCSGPGIESGVESGARPSSVHDRRSGRELVGEAGFEPAKAEPPDLQSGPFGHSGIPPLLLDARFDRSPINRPWRVKRSRRRESGLLPCHPVIFDFHGAFADRQVDRESELEPAAGLEPATA